jgi:hypothetical protein
MQAHRRSRAFEPGPEFDENAANFLNLLVIVKYVLVAQDVIEAQLAGLGFGFRPGVERPILRPKLFCGIAGHPESLCKGHFPVHRNGIPTGLSYTWPKV